MSQIYDSNRRNRQAASLRKQKVDSDFQSFFERHLVAQEHKPIGVSNGGTQIDQSVIHLTSRKISNSVASQIVSRLPIAVSTSE